MIFGENFGLISEGLSYNLVSSIGYPLAYNKYDPTTALVQEFSHCY